MGYGVLLVDADNAFNLLDRYLMLWNAHHRWKICSQFAFNRYWHHNISFVQDVPGKDCYIIKSKEGVAQGCVLGMFMYGIGLMPLCKKMRAAITQSLSL